VFSGDGGVLLTAAEGGCRGGHLVSLVDLGLSGGGVFLVVSGDVTFCCYRGGLWGLLLLLLLLLLVVMLLEVVLLVRRNFDARGHGSVYFCNEFFDVIFMDLPFHSLAWFIRHPRDLDKRPIQ